MRRKSLNFFVLILFFFAVAGCAKQAKEVKAPAGVSRLPAVIVAKLADSEKIATVKALIDAEVRVKGVKKRFKLAVVSKAPDHIRMEFMDPLAGPLMSLVSTPEQFVFADSSGFYFYEESDRNDEFKRITNLPWTPEETIRIIMGALPVKFPLNSEYNVDATGKYWTKDGRMAVEWDQEKSEVGYTQLNDKKYNAVIRYGGYKKEGGVEFPSIITLDLRNPKTKVSLGFESVELNSPIGADIFKQVNFVSYDQNRVK